jgi:hypothetical protein
LKSDRKNFLFGLLSFLLKKSHGFCSVHNSETKRSVPVLEKKLVNMYIGYLLLRENPDMAQWPCAMFNLIIFNLFSKSLEPHNSLTSLQHIKIILFHTSTFQYSLSLLTLSWSLSSFPFGKLCIFFVCCCHNVFE